MAPLGFFVYGGLLAVQALWAGPWLTRVAGYTALQAAEGLFVVNLSMLATFLAWGAVMPRLTRRGVGAVRGRRRAVTGARDGSRDPQPRERQH